MESSWISGTASGSPYFSDEEIEGYRQGLTKALTGLQEMVEYHQTYWPAKHSSPHHNGVEQGLICAKEHIEKELKKLDD